MRTTLLVLPALVLFPTQVFAFALLLFALVGCGPSGVVVVNATSVECQSAYVEADAPCDRGATCDVCTDNATGAVFWTCASEDGEVWTALDDDATVDVAGEVACRCLQDHLDATACEDQGLGWGVGS